MRRQLGRPDRGESIATHQLLDIIDRYGPTWPAALSTYSIEAIATAVSREIMARNLLDGGHLSEQGTATLARLRTADSYRMGRLTVRRGDECAEHGAACWRIDCMDCESPVSEHIRDGVLERTVVDLVARHRCLTPSVADVGPARVVDAPDEVVRLDVRRERRAAMAAGDAPAQEVARLGPAGGVGHQHDRLDDGGSQRV